MANYIYHLQEQLALEQHRSSQLRQQMQHMQLELTESLNDARKATKYLFDLATGAKEGALSPVAFRLEHPWLGDD